MVATYSVDVKRYFIETDEVNRKGNPITQPITIRKMFVTDLRPLFDSGIYRIVRVSRRPKLKEMVDGKPTGKTVKGEAVVRYSLSVIPRISQGIWNNPNGKCEEWFKLVPDKVDEDGNIVRPWKRIESMDEQRFKRWLAALLKEKAEIAFIQLETQEPVKAADGEVMDEAA